MARKWCVLCLLIALPAVPALPGVTESFQVNVHGLNANLDSSNLIIEDPERQLSPATQSFLGTLGTALGPIVGAIIGPLLTNIGQNLSTGSGAEAIAQLQGAAAQQQPAPGPAPYEDPHPPPAHAHAGRPTRPGKPPRRPSHPVRPAPRPAPAPAQAPAPASTASPSHSYNAVVLDVPGHGPFLFLMAANLSASAQAAAIQQAQDHAVQFLSGQSMKPQYQYLYPYPLQGALATKPSSAGDLPPRPTLPSYHSLDEAEDGEEEVAAPETIGQKRSHHAGTEAVAGVSS